MTDHRDSDGRCGEGVRHEPHWWGPSGVFWCDGFPACTCPHDIRPLGMLYGVNMGEGRVRLRTNRYCRVHNEHAYVGDGTEKCRYCGAKRVAWIHPETRGEKVTYD